MPVSSIYSSLGALSQSTKVELRDAQGHICGLFRDADEEFRTIIPFIKEGLDGGERAHHVVDPSRKEEHVHRMTAAGIDVDAVVRSGQLLLRDWSDVFVKGGIFERDRVFAAFADVHNESIRLGYPRTRFLSHMEWAVAGDRDELIEYEASYEQSVRQSPANGDAVICVYRVENWGGDLVMRTLRTHPLVIIGGVLHENPFYSRPEEVLADLALRRAARQECC
jgi:hypothetical protein